MAKMETDPGATFTDAQRISQALSATGWAWSFMTEGPKKSEVYFWSRGEQFLIQLRHYDGKCAIFDLVNEMMSLDSAMKWINGQRKE